MRNAFWATILYKLPTPKPAWQIVQHPSPILIWLDEWRQLYVWPPPLPFTSVREAAKKIFFLVARHLEGGGGRATNKSSDDH